MGGRWGGVLVAGLAVADGPEGEGEWGFFAFFSFFFCFCFVFCACSFGFVAAGRREDYGDDFAESASFIAGAPGVLCLRVETRPDFGFVAFEVGHEVVPCCRGAEGFDEDCCDGGEVFGFDVAEGGFEVLQAVVGIGAVGEWLLLLFLLLVGVGDG